MNFKNSIYYQVGRASDLADADRFIYRILEIIPGFLAWFTIIGVFLLSFYAPFYSAIFIIVFDIYWILKTIYLSIFLRQNWKKTKYNLSINWKQKLSNLKYNRVYHLILLPFYNESYEIIQKSITSLVLSEYDKKKFIVIIAGEERNRAHYENTKQKIEKEFPNIFGNILFTMHPSNVPGEMPGKGSNISYAIDMARVKILDTLKIKYEDVLVSAFDIDTVIYPQYFECLTWYFLTTEDPLKSSFQPIPVFNNNIWESPAFSRVVAFSATFWQMIQQERPKRLTTFSSHSVCFKTLYDAGYWQKNVVSEDSRIFWNLLLAHDGDHKVVPLCYPISMDANLAHNFWHTTKNVYKQQRRWAWGVENGPYVWFGFLKNRNISIIKKIRFTFILLEGYWSLSTNPLILFFLGWLPVILGGRVFNSTILSYNLPLFTKVLMTISMSGLFLCVLISMSFLPKPPQGYGRLNKLSMIVQWIMIPVTIILFGALPGLDAQTRLLLGKYMGFWVTPKYRKIK
ncbi:glycosyltransferase family 2 protein [Candidatus Nomurabacteria bacterium]|nr:glycosyltransferase family 2 protein [Candidatus Nomurabacteria bacterium]